MKPQVSFIFIVVSLICVGFLPKVEAVSPPPDGGYAGNNTAEGQNAVLSLTTGTFNTAVGFSSLRSLTSGNYNTGVGAATLVLNTDEANTACGAGALWLNTTGGNNTGMGAFALLNNTTGSANTATGARALFRITIGTSNTANGEQALGNNAIGSLNTAVGFDALGGNTSGGANTAVGFQALSNGNGTENTAVGSHARVGFGGGGTGNTAVGFAALFATDGSLNTALGRHAGFNLTGGDSNNIDIGANVEGVAGESNTIRIGNTDITDTYISGISGTTVASGAAVLVDSNGHLGTVTSSKRFKEDIKPMAKASEALFAFKPVTFRYKKEIDPAGTSQFGLVAEEVDQVNPDLVVRDKQGKPYSVRYEAVNAMLLNEFLKEHRKNEEQEATIARQQKQIDALTAGLQKVSAQLATASPSCGGLEVTISAPQVADSNY